MYSLSYKNIKAVVLYILTGLFAYSTAVALSRILEERTLGSILRHFLPITPYFFLIVLINVYDIRRFSFSSLVPNIPWNLGPQLILKRFILILLLAIPTGLFALPYLVEGGLLIGPVAILLFVSLFISCFYMMSEKRMFGILIYIVAIPFLFYFQRQLGLMGLKSLAISEIIIPLSAIFLMLTSFCFFMGQSQVRLKDVSNEEKRFINLCIFFVLMPVFSIIFSKDSAHSFIYYLMDLFLPIIYFFMLMRSIKTIEDIEKLILALVISMFLYEFHALYFMYKKGTIEDMTTKLYQSEIYTGFHPAFVPLIIPFQIAMYNLIKGWKRISIGLILLIFIIYLFLSNFRSAFIAAAVGFIVFYFFYYRIERAKKFFLSILGVLFVVVSLLYNENILEKLSYFRAIQTIQHLSAGASLESISSGRIEIWRATLEIIHDHPFWGIGPDMWSQYIWQYSLPIFPYKAPDGILYWNYAYDPHNLYALIWLNYGVLNIICYLIILCIAVKKGLRNIKESTSELLRTISLASFISLIIWMVMSIFTMRFFTHITLLYALTFWSIIAIIFKLNEFNSTIKDAQVVSNPINISS